MRFLPCDYTVLQLKRTIGCNCLHVRSHIFGNRWQPSEQRESVNRQHRLWRGETFSRTKQFINFHTTQDQLKIALHNLIQTVKEPYYTMKASVEKILPIIENVAERMKQRGLELRDQVKSVVNVIRKAMVWIKEVSNVCNKSKGTPFDQCLKAFETSIVDCR